MAFSILNCWMHEQRKKGELKKIANLSSHNGALDPLLQLAILDLNIFKHFRNFLNEYQLNVRTQDSPQDFQGQLELDRQYPRNLENSSWTESFNKNHNFSPHRFVEGTFSSYENERIMDFRHLLFTTLHTRNVLIFQILR